MGKTCEIKVPVLFDPPLRVYSSTLGKYPWTKRKMKPFERFFFKDPEEGRKARVSARGWVRRGKKGKKFYVFSKRTSRGMSLFFIEKKRR